METFVLESTIKQVKQKAHIDSRALKALCHFVDEKLDNYQFIDSPSQEHEIDSVRYGVFLDIDVNVKKPTAHKKLDNKVARFQVQKKIVLEEYWDKGIEPEGVIPYSIFKEVMLKFGLFRFEHLDSEGYTHIAPQGVMNHPEMLKDKKPIVGLTSNISLEMFLIKTLFVLGMCTIVADFYLGMTLIKSSSLIGQEMFVLGGVNVAIVFGFLGIFQLIHKKIDSISIRAMIEFTKQKFTFGIMYFTFISIIEFFLFSSVGFVFLFFLALGAYWTVKDEITNIYNPYYSEELRGKINQLIVPDGSDAVEGEKVLVNLLVQPPNEVKEMLKKIYPMPYSLAAESGAFKLSGEAVQRTINLLDEVKVGTKNIVKGFIERWNDKVEQEDPIIYRVHEKFDLVVIMAQYGDLKREKEAMEYIQNLSDNDIYMMM